MGLIAVPSTFSAQPQYPAKIAAWLTPYSPKIVVLPCAGTNGINGNVFTLTSGVSRPAGNYVFSGGTGYVDLGSDAYIDTGAYSIFVVSKINSFPVQYGAIAGIKNTTGNNALIIYSTNAAYADISFGQEFASYQYSLAAFGPVTGTWHSMVYTQTGATTGKLFCNGRVATKGGAAGLGGGGGDTTLGQFSPGTAGSYPLDGEIATFVLFKGFIPDAVAQALSANPWSAFEAPDEQIYISAGGGGSTGTAPGIAAAAAVGASNSASVGTSAGIAAASGTGSSQFSGVGSSSGIASATGVGAANFSGVGSASGIASAAAVGAIAGSSGTAPGIASANAVGSSTAASIGSASGIAAATGIGSSQSASVGSASGIAAAVGVGDYISAGSTTGTAAATSAASGVGASNATGIGSSSGVAAASGVSTGGAQAGGHYAGVAYTRKPKPRKHEKDDEIRQALLREIEGEQEEIIQSAAPIEVKQKAAAIVQPYVAEAESADIATLQQDLTRVKQLLVEWQAEVQRGIDEDEELLFMFH